MLSSPQPEGSTHSQSSASILPVRTPLNLVIVEDRPTDAELMVAELRRTGFDVRWVRVDGADEFARALETLPDIVLADYSLPEFDAMRALALLWEHKPDVPLIVVTGQLGDEAAAECMKLGACDYVLKDRLARLGPAVEIALQQRRLDLERRETERALGESEERLKLVLEGSENSFWDMNMQTGEVRRSPQLAVTLGYGESEAGALDENWDALIHPDDARAAKEAFAAHVAGRNVQYEAEYRLRKADGTWLWILDRGRIVSRDAGGRPLRAAGTYRDVSSAKQVQDRLTEAMHQMRALARRLQTVREEERAGIAREVHDELGQELTGLKMDVAWLSTRLGKLAPADEIGPLTAKLSEMSHQIDATIHAVRRISTELRPPVLDTLGLVPALEWQAADFANRTGIPCEFVSNLDDIDLDADRATAVFRIFQESLTNVARHANASRVQAELNADGASLDLWVQDNGVGMPADRSVREQSLGLLGMRERAMIFGGKVCIESAPGSGTRVTLTMPLPGDQNAGNERPDNE